MKRDPVEDPAPPPKPKGAGLIDFMSRCCIAFDFDEYALCSVDENGKPVRNRVRKDALWEIVKPSRALEKQLFRDDVLRALYKLGVENDRSEWDLITRKYGVLVISRKGSKGRPRAVSNDRAANLQAEAKQLPKHAAKILAKKTGLSTATVREVIGHRGAYKKR